MAEETRLICFRVSRTDEEKLERMRRGSRRPSIQNVLEAIVATTDESAPEWNIVPRIQESTDDNSDNPDR